jgi:hypothetical protein
LSARRFAPFSTLRLRFQLAAFFTEVCSAMFLAHLAL